MSVPSCKFSQNVKHSVFAFFIPACCLWYNAMGMSKLNAKAMSHNCSIPSLISAGDHHFYQCVCWLTLALCVRVSFRWTDPLNDRKQRIIPPRLFKVVVGHLLSRFVNIAQTIPQHVATISAAGLYLHYILWMEKVQTVFLHSMTTSRQQRRKGNSEVAWIHPLDVWKIKERE